MLLKAPGPTLVAALALTLAIGANSAIFSIVNGVLLRPLPYADSDRLAVIWESKPSIGKVTEFVTPPDFRDWRERQRVFDRIAAFRTEHSILTGRGLPERIESAVVSPAMFPLLGAQMRLGRSFLPDEDQPGKNRVAILSYGLWQRRFGGDSGILGHPLVLDGNDYLVVGIAEPKFRLPESVSELWIPYTLDAKELLEMGDGDSAKAGRSGFRTLEVFGHLRPGATFHEAGQEMQGIARNIAQENADTNAGWSVVVKPIQEQLVGNIRSTLLTLLGAVGFVLLIACTNVANLMLARAASREREIAIRTSLGASRMRIARQLLTESLVLSLGSAISGLALAYVGVRMLVALSPGNIPRVDEITVDWRVLAFTFVVAIFTGLLFGLAPAVSGTRIQLNEVLKAAGRSAMASIRSRRLRSALIVSEIALSVVLLIGASLMIRSFIELQAVNPGFRPDHVLTMRLTIPEKRYEGLRVAQFYDQLVDRVRPLPGVENVAVSRDVPLSGTDPSLNFVIEHRPVVASADQPRAKFRAVSADYFRTMGIPLRRGRYLLPSDTDRSPAVVVVNETLSRQFFANHDALGQRIQSGLHGSPWYTIVGIVGNVKHAALDAPTIAEIYYPYQQVPPPLMSFVEGTMTLALRSSVAPGPLVRAVGAQVQGLDPEQAVFKVASMNELVEGSVAQPRFRMFLLGVFAAVALILAATGLYGVISYSVSQRSNELGIRAALGAQRGDLLNLVLGEGARLAVAGAAIGLVLAFLLARTISKLLYGVKPHDPLSFIAVPLLLVAIAIVASYVPARRAMGTDPNAALRYE